jgi:3-oxoacyl-[acyl-carrier-protein] synthase II
MSERVVITGIAAWTCFGRGIGPLVAAMREGRRGDRPVQDMMFAGHPFFPSHRAMGVTPEPEGAWEGTDRTTHWPIALATETALDAARAARLGEEAYPRRRVGVVNGTSHGSNHGLLEYLRQAREPGVTPDAALVHRWGSWVARALAARLDARGVNLTINTACSSSLNAVGLAMRLLRSGRLDCVIAGGNDTFSLLSYAGFSSLRAVDPAGTRPFDVARQGMTLGDGAAYCVLEREGDARRRGAPALAAVTGYASAGEGHHATAPDPEGRGAAHVMSLVLAEDGNPRDLAFVSAHGTGTPANDGAEALALAAVARRLDLPGPILVSSLKSQVGHTLGSAGAVQIVATVAAMGEGFVPGTIGLLTPLPHAPPLSFPRAPVRCAVPLALCNSFGFGGSTASLCLRLP